TGHNGRVWEINLAEIHTLNWRCYSRSNGTDTKQRQDVFEKARRTDKDSLEARDVSGELQDTDSERSHRT
ncbi:hypothetical protein NPIL_46471, partial [Nephila pilipes]